MGIRKILSRATKVREFPFTNSVTQRKIFFYKKDYSKISNFQSTGGRALVTSTFNADV